MTELLLLPAALYAETHFRFRGRSPSALFRREPEAVFDMPGRLAPGRDLPVTLLINDIRPYPVRVESITIAVTRAGAGEKPALIEFDRQSAQACETEHPLKEQMSAYAMTVPRSLLGADGSEIFVNACLRYRRIGKNGLLSKNVRTVLNDNLMTSAKYSYRCFIAEDDYPGACLCTFGDAHCHSQFSRSHVEFGPPPEMTGNAAAASGLDFVAITDHSYDLACDPFDFLRQDRELRLWDMYKASVESYRGETLIIPGEEISVINSKGKVVHLCGLGVNAYIPGTLDGARKNIRADKQLTVGEAAAEISRQGGVSFAAHPGAKAGIMQRIFLKRGSWSDRDICENLGGVQAANGDFFDSWQRGKHLWINALRRGVKIPLLAGSDAHGDFNRYRAVDIPFVRIRETAERHLGSVRTGIYGKRNGVREVIDGIKEGATFVTNGPFLTICDDRRRETSVINSSKPVADATCLRVKAASSKEFGALYVIKVIMGRPGAAEETVIVKETPPDGAFEITAPIPAKPLQEACYLRAEAYGKSPQGLPTIAATSACFVGSTPASR